MSSWIQKLRAFLRKNQKDENKKGNKHQEPKIEAQNGGGPEGTEKNKIKRAQRQYDEIDLQKDDNDHAGAGDDEEKSSVDYTVKRAKRQYDDVVLNDEKEARSDKTPKLNYIEVEFADHPTSYENVELESKIAERKKEKVEYTDVIVD